MPPKLLDLRHNYQFQERKRKIGKKPQNEKLMQQNFEKREQVFYFGHSGDALLPVSTDLGRFPFSQNFRFNRLKYKWNAGFQRKFSGTDGQPSELLHFFRCNRSERKHAVPFARRRDFSRHFQCPVSRRSLTYL